MINILSYILFAFSVITVFLGGRLRFKEDRSEKENTLFFYFSLSSAGWSFCWSMLLAQVEPFPAYVWRSVGMVSVFAYLILGTILLVHWASVKGLLRIYVIAFSLLGIIIYPFNVRRSAISFDMEWFGMAYKFKADFWGSAYSVYSVVIAANMAIILIYMLKNAQRKYQKVLAKKLILCEMGLVFGMLLDTIFPMFGFGAFPGSTLGQAVSVMLMYPVVIFANSSRINFSNLSEYICYSTESPILIVDTVGNLKLSNDSALTFFNIMPEQLSSMHISSLFDIKPIPLPEYPKIMKLERSCKINQAYCDLHFSKIEDAYGDIIGFTIIVTDLTEKQNMIQQLAEERDRANKANEAKSSFLAKMSHEIRTPINAILGMDELLLREAESPSLKKYAKDIHSAGRSLLSIINDILDFSKIESGKMELVETTYHVGTMIHDIKNVVAVKAETKGLAFKIQLADNIPSSLVGDEVRIRQIIINLLNNAVKYTEKGEVALDISCSTDTGYATLTFKVIDTGIGIKKEDIPVLFDAFQRLDASKTHSIEGTGLGLSIVSRFVELMNGNLQVDSEYGKGSTFTFVLTQKIIDEKPIGSLEQLEADQSIEPVQQVQRIAPEARVLVVDDNRVNLAVLKGLLKRTKVQVDAVLSGAVCLEKVQEKHYHVIYLDHMMPEMDGIETLLAMKQLDNNLCKDSFVVALTANAILGAEEMYLSNGFDAYLSKPVETAKLEDMLFNCIPQELVQIEQ